MKNAILIAFLLLTCLQPVRPPDDITGKWLVDSVDVKMPVNTSAKEKQALNKSLVKPFNNATFNFKAGHHFSLSANLKGVPKADHWEYDTASGMITIKQQQAEGIVMKISITGEGDATFFNLLETPIILKVHKK